MVMDDLVGEPPHLLITGAEWAGKTDPAGGPIPVEVRTAELLARARKMRRPAKAAKPAGRKGAGK